MKVLFSIPKAYGFHKSFEENFQQLGGEVYSVNYFDFLSSWELKLDAQAFRYPYRLRKKWKNYFLKKVNATYLQEYDRIKPDIVLIYNGGMFLPETLEYFKKRSKVAFFLGDCPYYTQQGTEFISVLYQADAIYTYDTFWIEQLRKIGIKDIHFFYPHISTEHHHKKQLSAESYERLKSEVLYVGHNYKNNWGFKKAKFLSYFTDFEFQLHGNASWRRWFEFFPELDTAFREQVGYISVESLNEMYNATKIAPIDANPGLLNAIHWRIQEVLGSGTLPLLEWQKGVDEIFGEGAEVPAVKCFDEIKEMVAYYLENESQRLEKVEWMSKIMAERHSLERNSEFIRHTLKLGK